MALNAKQRETKELATAILEALDKDYDQEIDLFHQKIIRENQSVVLRGLKNLKRGRDGEKYEKK